MSVPADTLSITETPVFATDRNFHSGGKSTCCWQIEAPAACEGLMKPTCASTVAAGLFLALIALAAAGDAADENASKPAIWFAYDMIFECPTTTQAPIQVSLSGE
jgi:hypothetical protein